MIEIISSILSIFSQVSVFVKEFSNHVNNVRLNSWVYNLVICLYNSIQLHFLSNEIQFVETISKLLLITYMRLGLKNKRSKCFTLTSKVLFLIFKVDKYKTVATKHVLQAWNCAVGKLSWYSMQHNTVYWSAFVLW